MNEPDIEWDRKTVAFSINERRLYEVEKCYKSWRGIKWLDTCIFCTTKLGMNVDVCMPCCIVVAKSSKKFLHNDKIINWIGINPWNDYSNYRHHVQVRHKQRIWDVVEFVNVLQLIWFVLYVRGVWVKPHDSLWNHLLRITCRRFNENCLFLFFFFFFLLLLLLLLFFNIWSFQ